MPSCGGSRGAGDSRRAAAAIEEQPPALVGPISFWELTVLTDRGRIAVDREVSQWCRDLLTSGVVQVATLTPLAAISAARLREFHGDPADRFIYATTRELAVPLCSKDAQIRAVRRPAG